jgi:hypothetical protein
VWPGEFWAGSLLAPISYLLRKIVNLQTDRTCARSLNSVDDLYDIAVFGRARRLYEDVARPLSPEHKPYGLCYPTST